MFNEDEWEALCEYTLAAFAQGDGEYRSAILQALDYSSPDVVRAPYEEVDTFLRSLEIEI